MMLRYEHVSDEQDCFVFVEAVTELRVAYHSGGR